LIKRKKIIAARSPPPCYPRLVRLAAAQTFSTEDVQMAVADIKEKESRGCSGAHQSIKRRGHPLERHCQMPQRLVLSVILSSSFKPFKNKHILIKNIIYIRVVFR
jgi:hypothetical protein